MVAKIIEKLGKVFSSSFREKLERQESLDALVETLEAKEKKVVNKISQASENEKRALKVQLEVLQTQLEKARKLKDEGKSINN